MRKARWFVVWMVCLHMLSACGKNTAVVAISGLAGQDGTAVLIDTDDLTVPTVALDAVDNPSKVIVSPDGTKSYICGAPYPLLGSKKICVIDVANQTRSEFEIESHTAQLRYVWDMALNADGSKLVVGTWSVISGEIEIYDTATLTLLDSFPISHNWLTDLYKWGRKLVLDPTCEVVYLIATDGATVQVRAYGFDGNIVEEGQGFDNDILDLNNYDLAISPQGDLLLVVSTKIFPYKVTDAGLEALNPIEGLGSDDSAKFYGKTKILFTQNTGMIYVNSAGLYLPGVCNIGGSSYCLSKAKILANDPNPYVFSLVDFVNDDLIKWILGLVSEDVENIIDPTKLYGIADSIAEGDTCYMVIASVASTASDLTGLQGGKYVLAIFQTLPLIGNVWIGGKVIDTYPNAIGINGLNDTLLLSYFWKNQVGVFKKDPLMGWLLTDETRVDLGNYPQALSISTQKTGPL